MVIVISKFYITRTAPRGLFLLSRSAPIAWPNWL